YRLVCCFFFFQAEDGIRDFHVTGVQTCALPIFRLARLLLRLFQSEPEIMGLTALLLLQHARTAARFDTGGAVILLDDQDRTLWRSEERRVGKEGRSRWSREA